MKWKIEGTDGSGDDVIVIVEADDAETATRQASFAGVKVKAVHPDEVTTPAVRLPPSNMVVTSSADVTPPPGYTGKVVIEREDDDGNVHTGRAAGPLSGPLKLGSLGSIISHLVSLILAVIGAIVFIQGWILYTRPWIPNTPFDSDRPEGATANLLIELMARQSTLARLGEMLIGLLLIIVAILIEGFITRMTYHIQSTWRKQ
jgi:hypothetical protein